MGDMARRPSEHTNVQDAVTELPQLSYEQTLEAWLLYNDAFRDLAALAATRHLLTWNEFFDVTGDTRILKYVGVDEAGRMTGLGALTNQLDAWPTISPPYFARRWPQLAIEQRVWYVGFIGARKGSHVFPRFLQAMTAGRTDDLFVMDFCGHNEHRRLPEVSLALLRRDDPAACMTYVDRQAFYVVEWNRD